jgi:hypothetical protein
MKTIFLAIPILAMLTACSGNDVRSTLGLEYEEPDEFVVLSRPPLSVPPEFNLRPPKPGQEPKSGNPQAAARKALLGSEPKPATLDEVEQPAVDTAVTPVLSSDATSNGESLLLQKTGAAKADPDIRKKLGVDTSKPKPASAAKRLIEKINPSEKAEPLVDATKETERLRKVKQSGKKINDGKVPTIDPSKTSVIDKIF